MLIPVNNTRFVIFTFIFVIFIDVGVYVTLNMLSTHEGHFG